MSLLYRAPDIDLEDHQVVAEIHAMRAALGSMLRVPRRWSGGLRRTAQARAIQGSNTIDDRLVRLPDPPERRIDGRSRPALACRAELGA